MDNQQRDWVDALDTYRQYFNASAVYNGVQRRAANVKLTLYKDISGVSEYWISASFFRFEDEEDFLDGGDAMVSKAVVTGLKRRSKKKETEILAALQEQIDELLPQLGEGTAIYWDRPLRDAIYG